MNPYDLPDEVGDEEKVGPSVSSKSRARKSRPPWRVLLPPTGEHELSSDRISLAPDAEARALAQQRAQDRTPPSDFQKWAFVQARDARREGLPVQGSPTDDNPWHADIIFPRDLELQHDRAKQLAKFAFWAEQTDNV